MKELSAKIEKRVLETAKKIQSLSEQEFAFKPSAEKWSKKEIIGHLIDSAQNNIQRFVRGQYQTNPHIIYHQNEWVALQGYQAYDTKELVALWTSLNKHLCKILLEMKRENYERTCETDESSHSLKFLAEDYLAHMNHHLRQIE